MGTTISHPVPDHVTPLFCYFDIRALDDQPWASEWLDVKNYKWRRNTVCHRMPYSCTHMATVRVNGISY